MSPNKWMDKENVEDIYKRLLLSHKKEQYNAIYSNMDGPRDYHTVKQRKINIMISLTCGI